MKRTLQTGKRLVPTLVNPHPTFTALVRQGANQRSFHRTKSASPAEQAKEVAMTTKTAGIPAMKIHRILFASTSFADDAAVKTFLTEKGYSDFAVSPAEGGGFYVEDHASESFKGELRQVDHASAKGVSFLVGELAEAPAEGTTKADEPTAEDTDAAKAAEDAAKAEAEAKKGEGEGEGQGAKTATTEAPAAVEAPAPGAEAVNKAAAPRVRVRPGLTITGKTMNRVVAEAEALGDYTESDAAKAHKSFADMLSNYTGGMPPGIYEMADAMVGELRRIIKSGTVEEKTVAALANDFTRGVLAMHGAFSSIMATTKTAKGATPEELAEQLDAILDAMFGSAKGAGTEALELVADNTVSVGMEKLSEKMEAMQKSIDGVALLMLEQAQVAEKSAKTEAPVTEQPTRVMPERKSAAEVEAPVGDTVEAKKTAEEQAEAGRRTAKRLGINYVAG